jgi:hypothetical protein
LFQRISRTLKSDLRFLGRQTFSCFPIPLSKHRAIPIGAAFFFWILSGEDLTKLPGSRGYEKVPERSSF